MDDNKIIWNIRLNNLPEFLFFSCFTIILNLIAIGCFVNKEFLASIVLFIISLVFDYFCIKSIISLINYKDNKVFKKYNDIETIKSMLDNIYNNHIYEDRLIIMSDKYITLKKNYNELLSFNDVREIRKYQHKTNNTTDYMGILLIDKDNSIYIYKYRLFKEKQINELILLISKYCKNINK